MEVIKVVVDKLPVSCWSCRLSYFADGANRCATMRFDEDDVTDLDHRPDWCPLVEEGEE